MVDCSVRGCKKQLSVDCRFKTCDHCRKYKKQWRKKPENKQKAREYERSPKGRAKTKRYVATTKGAAVMARGKAKYEASDYGKAKLKERNARKNCQLMNRIATKICLMVNGSRTSSKTVNVRTMWKSSQEIKDHLESTFDQSWMNWSNYGTHRKGGPRRWRIGHRIPQCAYDPNIKEDVINCWKPENIFAQDAFENISLGDLLPDLEVLESLRGIWPKACD